ncbi:MAG TPA: ABC transporter ATP-binding protein [Solirubrobacteraceae bacterium]|nr:ABC transporter ATP-binding protein [Solirubrobacteraceae bacterium]
MPAVTVEGLSKTFRMPHEQLLTLKERAVHPFRRTSYDRLEALRDVSFAVERGEFFGIVGRNGSGKSTLLKCLAGIYRADAGKMFVNGRMSTFIELGVGFNPDLAARDNIVTNAIMLGLSSADARALVEPVLEFAELEDFVELKLKNYSSGMSVRLAFSVMIQAEADILLIDEVLAVGDAAFQQKCFDVFNEMRDAGRTILLVTHDMSMVHRFCRRAMLLERGELVMIGAPDEVADAYYELNFGRALAATSEPGHRPGDRAAEIIDAWMEDEDGARQPNCLQGRVYTFKAEVRFVRDVEDPAFTFLCDSDRHQTIFVATTAWSNERSGHFSSGESAIFSVTFTNLLAPGRYTPCTIVAHRGSGQDVIDRWDSIFSFVVSGPVATGGVVDLPYEARVERIKRARGAIDDAMPAVVPPRG